MNTYLIIHGNKIPINDIDFVPQQGMCVEYEGKLYQLRLKIKVNQQGTTADIVQECYLEY